MRAEQEMVIASGMIAMTWPMAMAYTIFGVVARNTRDTDRAAALALPLCGVLTIVAVVLLLRKREISVFTWVASGSALGCVAAQIWFVVGGAAAGKLAWPAVPLALLTGLVATIPIGGSVGALFGLEMAAQAKTLRLATTAIRRRTVLVLAIASNLALAWAIVVWATGER